MIFFGQGCELFMNESGDGTAEERIRALVGDGSERALARRRIVRRPLGGSYQTQPLIFGERERDSPSSLNTADPLSELLAHLTSSRKGQVDALRSGSKADSAASLCGLAALAADEGLSRSSIGSSLPAAMGSLGGAAPNVELRAQCLQELVLSALCASPDSLQLGPLDQPLEAPLAAAASSAYFPSPREAKLPVPTATADAPPMTGTKG